MSFISFVARVLQFVGHYSDLIDNLLKRRGCLVHWGANLEMHRATPPSNVRYLAFPTTVVLSGTLEGAINGGVNQCYGLISTTVRSCREDAKMSADDLLPIRHFETP
jgi:hypothetical protein